MKKREKALIKIILISATIFCGGLYAGLSLDFSHFIVETPGLIAKVYLKEGFLQKFNSERAVSDYIQQVLLEATGDLQVPPPYNELIQKINDERKEAKIKILEEIFRKLSKDGIKI